ncbi:hypothetical protein [Roseofilum capinflatum]|uniref:Uncharacterized protein n=1 Tax=Roseofilum capinflatum BLCC-M114 TaxID=3022440 RepID=A0ABT7B689_9CYAN|nr:hypothetical protein [Roseofilum capinflatum]MDJ1174692.1 hypothetical protein [Roseofilum capinflatum BLCC-M114]
MMITKTEPNNRTDKLAEFFDLVDDFVSGYVELFGESDYILDLHEFLIDKITSTMNSEYLVNKLPIAPSFGGALVSTTAISEVNVNKIEQYTLSGVNTDSFATTPACDSRTAIAYITESERESRTATAKERKQSLCDYISISDRVYRMGVTLSPREINALAKKFAPLSPLKIPRLIKGHERMVNGFPLSMAGEIDEAIKAVIGDRLDLCDCDDPF